MRRLMTASALLALGAFTLTAVTGQPPGGADKKQPEVKADKKPADPTDVAIAAALANDPDVRVAKAKIQLAEAELAKARQVVTLRVVTLKAKFEPLRARVLLLEASYTEAVKRFQAGVGAQSDLNDTRDKLETVKIALAEVEAELKLLTSGAAATDAAIATVLANDPDVRVSQAKIQLAEAELTKVRQGVTLRVLTVKAAVEEHKVAVEQAAERAAWAERMVRTGHLSQTQMIAEREKLAAAKAALTRAETELKLLTSGAPVAAAEPAHDKAVAAGLAWLGRQQSQDAHTESARAWLSLAAAIEQARERTAVKGPIPERIRAALDKPVKLGPKGQTVTFAKALEVFKKEAGLDVPIRPSPPPMPDIVSEGEELPVGAWFQMFSDASPRGLMFYVREYGLLIVGKEAAPPDAPTLTEFWKQKPPAKDAPPEPAPAPKKK